MIYPQFQQFLTLLILFAVGKYMAFVFPSWIVFFALLGWASFVEHFLLYLKNGRLAYFSYSAFSTAIGVMLMMAASHGWIYFVVVALALIQKRFLAFEGNHFFNPSNFALMSGLLLFYRQSHLVLGQLGDVVWLRLAVVVLAGSILWRVDRWRVPLGFVAGYLLLEYYMIVGYDPMMHFEGIYERFYSVSFVVFVAFMLTDPRTTPSHGWLQILFGVGVAVFAAGMDRWHGFRVEHLFMALFALSPWVPWLNAPPGQKKKLLLWGGILFFVAIGAIIAIEIQPPYYFEMDG